MGTTDKGRGENVAPGASCAAVFSFYLVDFAQNNEFRCFGLRGWPLGRDEPRAGQLRGDLLRQRGIAPNDQRAWKRRGHFAVAEFQSAFDHDYVRLPR